MLTRASPINCYSPSKVMLRNSFNATSKRSSDSSVFPQSSSPPPLENLVEDSFSETLKGVGVESHEANRTFLAGARDKSISDSDLYRHVMRLPVLPPVDKSPSVHLSFVAMSGMDWRLSNAFIGRLHSLTPGAVQYWRRKLGHTNFQHGWHLGRVR